MVAFSTTDFCEREQLALAIHSPDAWCSMQTLRHSSFENQAHELLWDVIGLAYEATGEFDYELACQALYAITRSSSAASLLDLLDDIAASAYDDSRFLHEIEVSPHLPLEHQELIRGATHLINAAMMGCPLSELSGAAAELHDFANGDSH